MYQSKVEEMVGPSETANGHETGDDKEMCHSLNEFLPCVFTSENLKPISGAESVYSGSPPKKFLVI